ncbi:MAG: hypothetical protein K0R27_742 [Xanthobacteraceae bacterium]|jgi:hypothetical protein|nr:hypothetical protein [Xanthobacteraceae bacterium]
MNRRHDASKQYPHRLTILLTSEDAEVLQFIADLRHTWGDPCISDAVRFLIRDHLRRLKGGEITDAKFYGKYRR